MADIELYSATDVAKYHEVTKACVSNWIARGMMPKPAAVTVGGTRLWVKGQITARPTRRRRGEA